MNPMTKTYALPEDIGQALAQYLSTKPYREVAHLMAALADLPVITVNEQAKRQDSEALKSA